MEAEASGARMGVQIDDDGFIAESSVAAVAMVDCDGALRSPRIATVSPRRRRVAVQLPPPVSPSGSVSESTRPPLRPRRAVHWQRRRHSQLDDVGTRDGARAQPRRAWRAHGVSRRADPRGRAA